MGEIDGAYHPVFIHRSVHRLAGQIEIVELIVQRGVFDAQISWHDFCDLGAVLHGIPEGFDGASHEDQDFRGIVFYFFVGNTDAAVGIGGQVITRVGDAVEAVAFAYNYFESSASVNEENSAKNATRFVSGGEVE